MENISIKILDISEYNGEVRGYSKGVNITIPSVIGYTSIQQRVAYATSELSSPTFVA